MGMFFRNLHIRKNDAYSYDELKKMLIGEMEKKGYTLLESDEKAEVSVVIYSPEKSEWVSITSDCLEFETAEETKAAALPFSKKFEADVLAAACFDSDYLIMNLINAADGTDGWVNVGSLYGARRPRRTNIAPWKGKMADHEKFKAIIKEKYVCAEEAFYGVAALLGMAVEQCTLDVYDTDEFEESDLTRLFFSHENEKRKELPKLTIPHFSLTPCKIGKSDCVFVNNTGGGSKGVRVMFVGDYIENDQLTFENVTFESDFGSARRKIVPIELRKVKTAEGRTALCWEDKSFHIPPAVDPSIPTMRRENLEFENSFGVRFTVRGNPRKVLDVKVCIAPLDNPAEGAACWCCYLLDGTKERYIEEFNKRESRRDTKLCLNPKDYDL